MFLKSLFAGGSKVILDPAEGHPDCKTGLDALANEDWDTLNQIYSTLCASDRYHWIQGMGQSVPLDFAPFLKTGHPLEHTILGGIWAFLALRFRGSDLASHTSQEAVEKMWEAIEIAEVMLSSARSHSPSDSVPPALLLRCALGSETFRSEISTLNLESTNPDDPCLFGAFNFLIYQTEKWNGSREAMWQACEETTKSRPNSAWLAITARANIEDWLWYNGFENNASLRESFSSQRDTQDFRSKLEQLDDMFWADIEQKIPRSELHFAHNNLGYLMKTYLFHQRAIRHIDAIGPYPSRIPWGYTEKDIETGQGWNAVRSHFGMPKLAF